MDTALRWADELGPPPQLPLSLQNVEQRAKLVDAIDGPLIQNSLLMRLSNEEKAMRLMDVAKISKKYITDVDDEKIRINISLRLWSGCLSAAKMIDRRTMSGPNTPDKRIFAFSRKIDPLARSDPIYCAGVEAAPSFKKLRKELYFFDGVPQNSAVRKYP
ncbi:MAG: hypothetical protein NWE79_07875 [Candidatus Bathyarchaeota archaeon]|nr:hypothetical protein [Candidatus Bathyarchaeota archaeon]